jgi:S1-C subfamily serine protease
MLLKRLALIFVNAVEKVSRSVVNIASVRTVHDQLFRVFPVEGVGSGVIIDEMSCAYQQSCCGGGSEIKDYAN